MRNSLSNSPCLATIPRIDDLEQILGLMFNIGGLPPYSAAFSRPVDQRLSSLHSFQPLKTLDYLFFQLISFLCFLCLLLRSVLTISRGPREVRVYTVRMLRSPGRQSPHLGWCHHFTTPSFLAWNGSIRIPGSRSHDPTHGTQLQPRGPVKMLRCNCLMQLRGLEELLSGAHSALQLAIQASTAWGMGSFGSWWLPMRHACTRPGFSL